MTTKIDYVTIETAAWREGWTPFDHVVSPSQLDTLVDEASVETFKNAKDAWEWAKDWWQQYAGKEVASGEGLQIVVSWKKCVETERDYVSTDYRRTFGPNSLTEKKVWCDERQESIWVAAR